MPPDPDDRVRAELIPDQITLMSRFDAIDKNLATLRNAIQGRGVTPVGSKKLAELVNTAQENWRAIRTPVLADMLPHPFDVSKTLQAWEQKINEIANAAIAEGIGAAEAAKTVVTQTVTSPGEAMDVLTDRVSSLGADFLRGALILVGGLGVVWVLSQRR